MTTAEALMRQIIVDIRSHLPSDESMRLSDREIWLYAVDHGPNTPESHAAGLSGPVVREEGGSDA